MTTGIIERHLITGTLVLDAPAHFGNGDAATATDMPVLRDSETGQPMLTGASIAGALRNFASQRNEEASKSLFGKTEVKQIGKTEVRNTRPSALCVEDAVCIAAETELRDGVALNPATRTAQNQTKFDFEIIPQGTRFELRFELALCEGEHELKRTLADALHALQAGHIALGKRKTRGFGACHVTKWKVVTYNYGKEDKADVMAWLRRSEPANKDKVKTDDDIFVVLGVNPVRLPSVDFSIDAEFALDGSILIRSDATSAADMGHLQSSHNGEMKPVLSGTSLAGALRARALRIANTLAPDKGETFVNGMFGPRRKENEGKIALHASHITIQETVIEAGITDLVQQRVKIDRFTGGAFPSALFDQQPLFAKPETRVRVKLTLRKPSTGKDIEKQHAAEMGMALLLLKDLWTGDLPVGGEISVGRGRLRGLSADVQRGDLVWKIKGDDAGKLTISGGNPEDLNAFVRTLKEALSQ